MRKGYKDTSANSAIWSASIEPLLNQAAGETWESSRPWDWFWVEISFEERIEDMSLSSLGKQITVIKQEKKMQWLAQRDCTSQIHAAVQKQIRDISCSVGWIAKNRAKS